MERHRFKKINAGGKGREWYLIVHVVDEKYERSATYSITFKAENTKEAKFKILGFLKKTLTRIGSMKNKFLIAHAVPLGVVDGRKVYFGDEMLRPKRAYCNRKILGIKNPDRVFVQGAGPEVLKNLGEN